MDPTLLTNFQLGIFSAKRFKKEFIKSQISYVTQVVGEGFNSATKKFLKTLTDQELLDIYLDTHNYFTLPELARLQLSMQVDWEFRVQLCNYVHELFGIIPKTRIFKALTFPEINRLVKTLLDPILSLSINLAYILELYLNQEEVRNEIKLHRGLVKRLTQANRNATYIWGDLLAEAGSEDYLLWPMAPLPPLPE